MVAGHLAVTEHAEHHELRGGATQENVIAVLDILEALLHSTGTETETVVPVAISLGVVCDGGENHQDRHERQENFFTHHFEFWEQMRDFKDG